MSWSLYGVLSVMMFLEFAVWGAWAPVLAEIKPDPDLRAIPIVVLTSSNAEQDVVKSYDLHANCYIVKPVDFAGLMEVVRSIGSFWLVVATLPPDGRK